MKQSFMNGYYDKHGCWQRTKLCFMSCGHLCDCGPPGGLHYNAQYDTRTQHAGGSLNTTPDLLAPRIVPAKPLLELDDTPLEGGHCGLDDGCDSCQ